MGISDQPAPKGVGPQFREKPKIIPDPSGKAITFQCVLVGSPQPNISWFKDGSAISPGGRYSIDIKPDGDTYILTMRINVLLI